MNERRSRAKLVGWTCLSLSLLIAVSWIACHDLTVHWNVRETYYDCPEMAVWEDKCGDRTVARVSQGRIGIAFQEWGIFGWGPCPWHEVHLAVPLLLTATLTVISFFYTYRHSTLRPGCCTACGYNLTGNVSGICPECGTKTGIAREAVDSDQQLPG